MMIVNMLMIRTQESALQAFKGLLFLSAETVGELKKKLSIAIDDAKQGRLPGRNLPELDQINLSERLVIDFTDGEELVKRADKALQVIETDNPGAWQALTAQGIFRGGGKPGKVAFLFPGQGSQYINMLSELASIEPLVADTFREADEVMTPLLGKPLTSYIFVDGDEAALKEAEKALKNTAITQPAMLTADVALFRLISRYGFKPDYVLGHSLGEYAALVASGALSFGEALEVVSACGREMVKLSVEDNGCMAAVSAPLPEVEKILSNIEGYVVIANVNSPNQSVIGGATKAVEDAIAQFWQQELQAAKIPVSHAFHTKIVAPASEPLRKVIEKMNYNHPKYPLLPMSPASCIHRGRTNNGISGCPCFLTCSDGKKHANHV